MTVTKQLRDFSIKSASRGEVVAVFATFNAIDGDGDVTLPGAFTDGAPVVISAYGHQSWAGELPVGKGQIKTTPTEAQMHGQFLMNTTSGRDTFETVRHLSESDLQEWSYSLADVKSHRGTFDGRNVRFLDSVTVKEVSPVLAGAGIATRTLSLKSSDEVRRQVQHEWERFQRLETEHVLWRSKQILQDMRALSPAIAPASHTCRYVCTRPPDDAWHDAAVAMRDIASKELSIDPPPMRWIKAAAPSASMYDVSSKVDILGGYRSDAIFVRADAGMSFREAMSIVAHEVRHAAGGDEAEARAFERSWFNRLERTHR